MFSFNRFKHFFKTKKIIHLGVQRFGWSKIRTVNYLIARTKNIIVPTPLFILQNSLMLSVHNELRYSGTDIDHVHKSDCVHILELSEADEFTLSELSEVESVSPTLSFDSF